MLARKGKHVTALLGCKYGSAASLIHLFISLLIVIKDKSFKQIIILMFVCKQLVNDSKLMVIIQVNF